MLRARAKESGYSWVILKYSLPKNVSICAREIELCEVPNQKNEEEEIKKGTNSLLRNLRRTNPLRPNNTIHILQLAQYLTRIGAEILMYNNLHLLMAFGLWYRPAGED